MPDVTITVDTAATAGQAWAFVEEMDNWAPFLTGYQSHTKLDDRESLWVVRGELGGLSRIAEFRVMITEWIAPQRVTFTLEGIDEPFMGTGSFVIQPGEGAVSTAVDRGEPCPQPTVWRRLVDWVARRLVARIFGGGVARTPEPVRAAAPSAGAAVTSMTFHLNVNAGGGSGPILNLLLAPMLKPVAEDMAGKIVAALETRNGRVLAAG